MLVESMAKRLTAARLGGRIDAVQFIGGDHPTTLGTGSEEERIQARLFEQMLTEVWRDKTLGEQLAILTDLGVSEADWYRDGLASPTETMMVHWPKPWGGKTPYGPVATAFLDQSMLRSDTQKRRELWPNGILPPHGLR